MGHPRLCLPSHIERPIGVIEYITLEGFSGMTTWELGPLKHTIIAQYPGSARVRALQANPYPDLLVSFVQRHLRFLSATLR